METKEKTFGLIPFYVDPQSSRYTELVDAQHKTVDILKEIVDEVVAINDGSRLSDFLGYSTFHFTRNMGKAEAVREGIKIISNFPDIRPTYIIQTDADLDQKPHDAKLLLSFFQENKISPDSPVLVIGDRYFQGQANTSEHRLGLLVLQHAFCKALGFDVRDPVSGMRGYTAEFTRRFNTLSKSQGYGIEIEQIVIANLIGAKVYTIPLSYSRLRDPSTLSSKFLQSVNAILSHQKKLESKGYLALVHFFQEMKRNMENCEDYFILDLKYLGNEGILGFRRSDNKYSINLVRTSSTLRSAQCKLGEQK